ncbi:MAG: prepilin-type N-terminal cleavage/methylation domain-containing protein [Sulfurovaceae bacterium]|nr:prepilin-type N-terminal cleavage/methylation domain-containing protein [Sulfurovaceae bacterium]
MYSTVSFNSQKGFTLIELIIVVLIISMMGFMVFSSMVTQEKKIENLNPLSLRSTLQKTFGKNEDLEFFCIHKSTDCYVAKGSEIIAYEGILHLGKDIEIYKIDYKNRLEQIEEFGRIKDEKITFSYNLYSNGSGSQMVLANSEGVYYLPSYFGKAQKVENLDEAQALWIKEDYDLTDKGNYY